MDEDTNLPTEQKIGHKVWKIRCEGYEELIKEFGNSRSPNDECFRVLNGHIDTVKSIVTDLNVVAQEKGLGAINAFLEFGGSSQIASRFVSGGVVAVLVEKALPSARAATKQSAMDALSWLVFWLDSGESIVDAIVGFLDHRLPKLVAGAVNAVFQLLEGYGYGVVRPQAVIEKLPKLFSHADKTVRSETTKLAVEMYKWIRQGLTSVLLDQLRPVQQRDLSAEFEKVSPDPPQPKRLTHSQLEKQRDMDIDGEPECGNEDKENGGEAETEVHDPLAFVDPVNVISQLPSDLSSRMSSSKWKDRKDALDEVHAVLGKAPKMASSDYSDLVRLLAKCMKDANIQVVQTAALCVELLCKGLNGGFSRYQHVILAPTIERLKEKKPAVAGALAGALDAIYAGSSLNEVLDEILQGMIHKTPQIKIASTNYLQRCLATTKKMPSRAQIDSIMDIGVKLLSDSQEPVRQAATEMIGVLMKITGERELRGFLEKVDENRLNKVRQVFTTATVAVTASAQPASAPLATKSVPKLAPPRMQPQNQQPFSSKAASPSSAASAIPSKRTATSPAKKPDAGPRTTSRSLTGRQLISPTVSNLSGASSSSGNNATSETVKELTKTNKALEMEVARLQEENKNLRQQNGSFSEQQNSWAAERAHFHSQIGDFQGLVEQLQEVIASKRQALVDAEAETARWKNEAENYKLKITSMEQVIAMMKLNSTSMQADTLIGESGPASGPGTGPASLHELSSRVNRLSIDGHAPELSPPLRKHSPEPVPAYDFKTTDTGNEEENWKKATEVTAQLKARIEKMKQRNRMLLSR